MVENTVAISMSLKKFSVQKEAEEGEIGGKLMTLEEFKKELADIDKGVRPFPATAQVSHVVKTSSLPLCGEPCSGAFTSSLVTHF